MTHCEPIEWRIVRVTRQGTTYHSEGAQSVFSLSRAEKVLKVLGAGWKVVPA